MRGLVIQSIWLSIVVVVFTFFFQGNFSLIVTPIIGMIPFLYLKKSSRKDVLKLNVLSSIIAFIVLIAIYLLLYFSLLGIVDLENNNLGIVGNSPLIYQMISFLGIYSLLLGSVYLLLFNLPILLFFLFGKKKISDQKIMK
jgi:hypothetical protein